jgi:hypothetical protein
MSLDILVVTGAEIYLASTELEASATVTVSLVRDSITPPSPPPSLPPPVLFVVALLDLLLAKERALAAMLLLEREVLLWTDPSVKMPLELLVTIPPSLPRDQLI